MNNTRNCTNPSQQPSYFIPTRTANIPPNNNNTTTTANTQTSKMPEVYAPRGYAYDRNTAREMIAAIQYVPSHEQSAALLAAEQDRKARKAAKKARNQRSIADDAASVSSFGSTVGLLKARLFRRGTRSERSEDEKKRSKELSRMMRHQVNIGT